MDINSIVQPAAQVGLLAWGAAFLGRKAWVSAPQIVSWLASVRPTVPAPGTPPGAPPASPPSTPYPWPFANDRHTIIDIAERLDAKGNRAGVDLCYKLLDVMKPPTEAKS